MELRLPPESSNEEACLITISTIARHHASRILPFEDVEKLTQEVVLDCLVSLRSGKRWIDTTTLSAFVRNMVRRRASASARGAKRRSKYKTTRTTELAERGYAWGNCDPELEELQLLSFHARTLASLSNSCRRAYRMVREQKAPYGAVVDALRPALRCAKPTQQMERQSWYDVSGSRGGHQ